MPGFKGLPSSDVDALLTHMLDSGILFEDSGLWGVGRQGEEEFGGRNFMDLLSAFVSEPLFSVRHGVSSIGHVHPMTFARWDVQATVLVLGGRSWLVTHVDWDRKVAYVEPSQSEGKSRWAGAGQPIRFAVCQAIREVLLGAELPGSLSKRAETELADVRSEFAWLEAGATSVVRDPAGEVRWWTFGGLHANGALAAQLYHQPTLDYVARRTADGRTRREIIRCLKRFLAREIFHRVMTDFRTRQAITRAA